VLMESQRDEAIRALTRHCGDGRLTLDELEERIQEAYAATTEDELRHALRELPAPRDEPAPAEPPVDVDSLDDIEPVVLPGRRSRPDVARDTRDRDKAIGTLITIGGFILLFNGFFWLALICWFVLPGLILKNKRGC
jgi:hypothetical protein